MPQSEQGWLMLRKRLRPLTHAIRSVMGTAGLSARIAMLEKTIAAGHVTSVTTPAIAAVSASSVAPALDINLLLHESRGAMLRAMPRGANRILSAGCAGTWYFDWIEQTYGRVPEHLGIEFYTPKPDDLPDNVTWICNTASDMSGVAAGSCDLIFSGQNLEHLWPEEVAGFMLEAARVIRPGGHLVVDSPNRLMTAPLNWSHPQHTIELTLDEIATLAQLAGFDVTATRGIWLCRDARDDRMLPFDPNQPCVGWSVTERLLAARDRPDDAFIWWMEAVRVNRAPDSAAIISMMTELFRQYWPERVQRLLIPPQFEVRSTPEGKWIVVAAGQGGAALYGPYMPLRAGRHRVTWWLEISPDHAATPIAVCEVLAEGHAEPLARQEVYPGTTSVTLEFALSETTFGLQFRCLSLGIKAFSILSRIGLAEHIR